MSDVTEACSTVTKVEWTVGRRGDALLVVDVVPVSLEGVTVSRVGVESAARAKELDVAVGDEVIVHRASGVIPTIDRVVRKGPNSFSVPQHCVGCGGAVVWRGDDVYCASGACVRPLDRPRPRTQEPVQPARPSRPPFRASRAPGARELRERYGFEFPDDLFALWELARRLQPRHPDRAFEDALGVNLVGPFDVLAGRFAAREPALPLCVHWRSYMDPPEFFTVMQGDVDGEHWGYWLDEPDEGPRWVASYFSGDGGPIEPDGPTVFHALRALLEICDRDAHDHLAARPLDDDVRTRIDDLARLRDVLRPYANGDRPETGEAYVLAVSDLARRARRPEITLETCDGMGIVVPKSSCAVIDVSPEVLRTRLQTSDGVRDVVEQARAMLASGYAGTALALAKGLWTAGERCRAEAVSLSVDCYRALGRPLLASVAEAHHATWREGRITIVEPIA